MKHHRKPVETKNESWSVCSSIVGCSVCPTYRQKMLLALGDALPDVVVLVLLLESPEHDNFDNS